MEAVGEEDMVGAGGRGEGQLCQAKLSGRPGGSANTVV